PRPDVLRRVRPAERALRRGPDRGRLLPGRGSRGGPRGHGPRADPPGGGDRVFGGLRGARRPARRVAEPPGRRRDPRAGAPTVPAVARRPPPAWTRARGAD